MMILCVFLILNKRVFYVQKNFPSLRKLILLVGDISATVVATYLAVNVVFIFMSEQANMKIYYDMMPINVILMGMLFNVYGLFSLKKKRYGEIFLGILISVFYSLVIMMAISFFLREFAYSRSVLLLTAIGQLFLLNFWQYSMWRIEMMLSAPQRALIIGSQEEAVRVLARLSISPQLKYEVSYVSTDSDSDEWKDVIYTIDLIVICSDLPLKKKENIVNFCQQLDKQVLLMPSVYELFCSGLEIDKIDDIPFFQPKYLKLTLEKRSLKRIVDLIISSLAIILLSPIMVLVAITIKLDSKGPILYSQVRTGRYENEFKVYKFRSMKQDAERNSGPVMAQEQDARITKVGKFIRATRLDELPQLFNVLMGDMSIVGPRPERPFFVKQFKKEIPEYLYRHNVKPGITGMAQVYGKYNTTVYDKLIYDLMYIQKCDLFMDFVIMIQTVRVLLMKSSTEGVSESKGKHGLRNSLKKYRIKEDLNKG